MTQQEIVDLIKKELPPLMQKDEEFRRFVLVVCEDRFADKAVTEDRFDKVLAEIQRDREEQSRKWDEQNRKWDEQVDNWKKNHEVICELIKRLDRHETRLDSSIGALGARWGLHSEDAFRNGLKAILEESFGVQVINVNEFDDDGTVFGRPDQVELDIIIKNSTLIICELKSSMSKSDIYSFEKKARFYETKHERKADRLVVISPMIDPKARTVADTLGIESYSHAYDVRT